VIDTVSELSVFSLFSSISYFLTFSALYNIFPLLLSFLAVELWRSFKKDAAMAEFFFECTFWSNDVKGL